MNADDTLPTPDDDAVERFAEAVDGDRAHPELARELEVVALLAKHRADLDPEPEARERARARLMAALYDDAPRVADDGPSRAS